ncbi:neprosin family prolyl endopeptidase [Paraburkholderia sp. EG285A]|uniref:neprosin family prolyl endopeptidase n=1 Tax=Paraburkholderia sp. EG285A TaxID=3237009 RepID=UPI0034D22B20
MKRHNEPAPVIPYLACKKVKSKENHMSPQSIYLCAQEFLVVNPRNGKQLGRLANTIQYVSSAFLIGISTWTMPAYSQSMDSHMESFDRFMADTKAAAAQDFIGHPWLGSGAHLESDNQPPISRTYKVNDTSAFEVMRQAIIERYNGVHVSGSFIANGQTYDCVPVMEQPAVRRYQIRKIATPPQLASATNLNGDLSSRSVGSSEQLQNGVNTPSCGTGSVPLNRVTLEELSRFTTVDAYHRKAPPPMTRLPSSSESANAPFIASQLLSADTYTHKYATFEQNVENLGGNVTFNVWNPKVDAAAGQFFSLSQIWIIGGDRAGGANPLQSEETGWVVSPSKFGDNLPHFFIYSTADNYVNTGCWNNSCGDFVQVSEKAVIGGALVDISSPGGQQHEFSAGYHRDAHGNWWVFRDGVAIGYYPAEFYQGGQNSHNATLISFGTETTGLTSWPGAGSGNWDSPLYGHAAYQRNLYYYNLADTAAWDDPHLSVRSTCYHAAGPFSNGDGGYISADNHNPSWWTRYVFVGGPGGTQCR